MAGTGALALVYRGPAALPGCPEAVAQALRRSRWGLDVRFVGPREPGRVLPAVRRLGGHAARHARPER